MNSDAFREQLAALSAEYRGTLPDKLSRINALWAQAVSGSAEAEGACSSLLRELHTLAGSARTFGLPEVSTTARAAETFLESGMAGGRPVQSFDHRAFGQLLDTLHKHATE